MCVCVCVCAIKCDQLQQPPSALFSEQAEGGQSKNERNKIENSNDPSLVMLRQGRLLWLIVHTEFYGNLFIRFKFAVVRTQEWTSTHTHTRTQGYDKLIRNYVEIKCQLDATEVFLLQILLLAQHVSGITMPIIRSSKKTLLHLVGILFPHINGDARSKSQQIHKELLLLFD